MSPRARRRRAPPWRTSAEQTRAVRASAFRAFALLFPFELEIFVGRRVGVVRDQPEAMDGRARAHAVEEGWLDHAREHRALVDHLLDLVEELMAHPRVHLVGLLGEEPVDVGVGAVGIAATRDGVDLDAGGGIARRAAAVL